MGKGVGQVKGEGCSGSVPLPLPGKGRGRGRKEEHVSHHHSHHLPLTCPPSNLNQTQVREKKKGKWEKGRSKGSVQKGQNARHKPQAGRGEGKALGRWEAVAVCCYKVAWSVLQEQCVWGKRQEK